MGAVLIVNEIMETKEFIQLVKTNPDFINMIASNLNALAAIFLTLYLLRLGFIIAFQLSNGASRKNNFKTILSDYLALKESYKEGYINLNRKVFRRGKFKKLKANEKWLLLEFLKLTHSSGASHQIGTKNFYEKYKEILNVTTRVLRYYLHSLKFFFHIGIKDKKYFITYIGQIFNERSHESEEEQYLWQRIRVCCRREKVKDVTERSVRDTANLVSQYRNLAEIGNQDIISILLLAVRLSVQEQANKRLHSKYVHKILRKELGLI